MQTPDSIRFTSFLQKTGERNIGQDRPIGRLPWESLRSVMDGSATGGGNPVGLKRGQKIPLDGWALLDLFS